MARDKGDSKAAARIVIQRIIRAIAGVGQNQASRLARIMSIRLSRRDGEIF